MRTKNKENDYGKFVKLKVYKMHVISQLQKVLACAFGQ